MQPKTRKLETSGFLPYHLSYGVTPVAVVITRFFMYAAEQTASAQKLLDTPACSIIDKAASWSVLFICSVTPFCCGEWGTVVSW